MSIPGVDERISKLWAECIEAVERGDRKAAKAARAELDRLQPTPNRQMVRSVGEPQGSDG